MKQLLVIVAALLVVVAAIPRVKRQSSPEHFQLPANFSAIVRNLVHGFDCAGRQYGYYADMANNCQVFHVCMPADEFADDPTPRMWSFICGEGTVFDQAQLVCNFPEHSLACGESENLYRINDYFGRVDREFRDGLNDIF